MSDTQKELARIQQELKAPKSQRNSFGKYNYRSCEDILEAVKPILGGCVLTVTDSIEEVSGRIYVKAEATLQMSDSFPVSTTAYAREPETKKGMDESQITGAASSYARKYALSGLFCIDDTRDADATNEHDKPEKKKTQAEKDLCFWGESELNKFEDMSEASIDAWGVENKDRMQQLEQVDQSVYWTVKKAWAKRKKVFTDAV